MKRSVPRLSDADFVRWLGKLFKVGSDAADVYQACSAIGRAGLCDWLDDQTAVLYERQNVRGTLTAMRPSNLLVQILIENSDNSILLSDASLPGAESLYLVCSTCSWNLEEVRSYLSSTLTDWVKGGVPSTLTAGLRLPERGYLGAIALQLSTYTPQQEN